MRLCIDRSKLGGWFIGLDQRLKGAHFVFVAVGRHNFENIVHELRPVIGTSKVRCDCRHYFVGKGLIR